MKQDFEWYRDKTQGDINTLGLASDYQELLTRMEVELQNLQDALINQDLHLAMAVLACEQNVGSLMGMKMEHALENNDPGVAPRYLEEVAPIIECPYCLREMQTVENDDHGWVLPEHSLTMHADNVGNSFPRERQTFLEDIKDVDCPNSGKGPAAFLIKE